MTRPEILERVQEVLTTSFEVPAELIKPEAHLYTELDLDSLDSIDLAVKLKSETGIVLEEEQLREIRTVGDIVDTVHTMLAKTDGG